MSIYSGIDLEITDLLIDAIYKGEKTANGGLTDPLVRLVGVSRQGGFRYRGKKDKPTLLVLTSNLSETEWPDELDPTLGSFIYWGDNRKPGNQLHDTPRFGNSLLQKIFEDAHCNRRKNIPPILIFTSEGTGRSFRFRGLAVPGYPSLPGTEDLTAIWKTSGNERFQNYRAIFTILDTSVVKREWIHAMAEGQTNLIEPPVVWSNWQDTGVAKPLLAPKTQLIRNKQEQLPAILADRALIEVIKNHYKNNEVGFEACAGELTKFLLTNVTKLELTRPWRDGGRDGIGLVKLGQRNASIQIVFALEAKCYGISKSVGVRDVSRLISRIKYREFGVLVTTSFIGKQAYKEVADDGHPVIFITAIDIVGLLRSAGYNSPALVLNWLKGIEPYS